MKTSQQIAEEMAAKFAQEQRIWTDGPPPSEHTQRVQDISTKQQLLEEIPLTQLIEVAMAANKSHCADDAFTYQDGELIQALDALKQTGKAEWL